MVEAISSTNIDANAIGVSGGLGWVGLTGAIAGGVADATTAARLSTAGLEVSGKVDVVSRSTADIDADAVGATLVPYVAITGVLSIAEINATTTAALDATGPITAGGNVAVVARHNHDGAGPTGGTAEADAISAAGGWLAIAGALAEAKASGTTTRRAHRRLARDRRRHA